MSQYSTESSKFSNELFWVSQETGLYELSLQRYEKSFVKVLSKTRSYCLNSIGCIHDYLK